MKITAPSPVAVAGKETRGTGRKIPVRAAVLVALAAAAFFTVLTYGLVTGYFPNGIRSGIWKIAIEDYGYQTYGTDSRLRQELIKMPGRLLRNPEIPRIYIDIGFKDLQTLYARREEALEAGILIQQSGDYVPARIRVGEDTVRVKLRLKGDWTDHLAKDKWSFRIHTKGKDQLFGMRRFSIQHPATRGYQGEVIYHETLRRFGVMTPRYFFVDVFINGDEIGIMALEEHFSKELLEHNGRKEGVIIRFDESRVWDERLASRDHREDILKDHKDNVFENYLNAPLDAFESSRIGKSERLSREYAIAVGLLRGFMDGSLPASDVFDVEQLGAYLAVTELWGVWHEVVWHNLRFYLNPLTLKLEPIAFDANLEDRKPVGITITDEPIVARMLEDPVIDAVFRGTLDTLVEEVENGNLIAQLQQTENTVLETLQSEYVMLEAFDYEELRQRAEHIPARRPLNIDPDSYPVYVNAYLIQDGGEHYLELSNALPYPVEIQSIDWVDKSGNKLPIETPDPLDYPFMLTGTARHARPVPLRIDYRPHAGRTTHRLEVRANIRGYDEVRTTVAQQSYPPLDHSPMPAADLAELFDRHPFLSRNGEDPVISVQAGLWRVAGSIVIPRGYELVVPAGTTLQFEKGGSLIVYGTTLLKGTAAAPVILEGQAGDDGQVWQGVAVHQASRRSLWSHVSVRNTTGVDWPEWKLTGGVTFYKSDVDMDHCSFSGNRAEDALNIVHSDFSLNEVDFSDTLSDAFDGDFTTGTVAGGQYQDIGTAGGGDGVDVSGSTVSVEGTHFIRVDDKAISVGEDSTVSVAGVVIENSGVGVASKDKSRVDIADSTIRNAKIAALMAYTKKPEFGPARLTAHNISILDSAEPALAQQGSRLELDGRLIATQHLDIENLYKTAMKPGVSK